MSVSPRRGRRPREWNRYYLSHPANGEADAHSTIEGSILFAAFELSAPCPKRPPYPCSFRAKPRFLTARQGNLSGTKVLLGVRKTAKYWLGFGLDSFFCVSGPDGETTLASLCLLAKQAVGFSLARGRRYGTFLGGPGAAPLRWPHPLAQNRKGC